MIVVDSSVWIDYFRGMETLQTVWLERELTERRLALTDLILCEVLRGFRREVAFEQASMAMKRCVVLSSSGETLAIAAANNYRLLRSRGIAVRKTIDCLIATFCLAQGHTLLHNDRDFEPFEEMLGLQVVHPHSHRSSVAPGASNTT